MDIFGWKRNFLGNRGLTAPTAAPLYTYRMTKPEFDDLEIILREYLEDRLRKETLGDLARENPNFCSAFVFYASEWWKRRFSGHYWTWAPILQDLGADPNGWGQNRRSQCIEIGLEQWDLRLANIQGFHYLANIAFNGGLPLQLVAEAQGSIGRMLSRVLRNATGQEEIDVLVDWIRSISSAIPKAYQFDEVFHLLATIAREIIRLTQEARLSASEGAVESLDREIPHWRETLPITIDDAQTQGLINQLIAEAAAIKIKPAYTSGLRIERSIESDENGIWHLRSILNLQQYMELEQLENQFHLTALKEHLWLSLLLSRGDLEFIVSLRKSPGQDRFRLDRLDPGVSGLAASAEHVLTLSLRDGHKYISGLASGSALADDSPWLFSAESPDSCDGVFLRQRGGKIPGSCALLVIPQGWNVAADPGGQTLDRGFLDALDRKVYSIKGSVVVFDPAGSEYSIVCGRMEEEYSYELQGNRIWGSFLRPGTAYVGVPRLIRTDLETGRLSTIHLCQWKYSGGSWLNIATGMLGPVTARYSIDKEVLWSGRMVLLPEGYRNDFIGGASPDRGSIVFKNAGFSNLTTLTEGVHCQLEKTSDDIRANLWMELGKDPPESVEFLATWPRNPDSAKLILPFPSLGIRIFRANGSHLESGTMVSLKEVVGMRIVAFAVGAGYAEVEMLLEEYGKTRKICGMTRHFVFDQVSKRLEIRLVEYEPDLSKVLSASESLDAIAILTIRVPDCAPAILPVSLYSTRLELSEYECKVRMNTSRFASYENEALERLQVLAIRLDARGSEPITLEPLRSESVHRGEWLFPVGSLESGPWLIYPDRQNPNEFRPVLWSIEINDKRRFQDFKASRGSLRGAIQLIDQDLRKTEIRAALKKMVDDRENPGWQLAEWLASQTSHLHLLVLDLWRGFVEFPEAMAIFTFRVGNLANDFFIRFSDELPFLWQFIPLSAWQNALMMFTQQLSEIPESVRYDAGQTFISKREEVIATACPIMKRVFFLVHSTFDELQSPEIFRERVYSLAQDLSEQLFSGPDSEYQKLLQRHGEDTWPENMFQEESKILLNSSISNLIKSDKARYRMCVLNSPLLLAAHVTGVIDLSHEFERSLGMRFCAIRDFDPDWFDSCYFTHIIGILAQLTTSQALLS